MFGNVKLNNSHFILQALHYIDISSNFSISNPQNLISKWSEYPSTSQNEAYDQKIRNPMAVVVSNPEQLVPDLLQQSQGLGGQCHP